MSKKIIQSLISESFNLHGENTAIQMSERTISYHELEERMRACIVRMRRQFDCAEKFVGILVSEHIDIITLMLGLFMERAVMVPLDPNLPDGRIRDMLAVLDLKYLCLDQANRERTAALDLEGIEVFDVSDESFLPLEERISFPEPQPEDKVYVYFTSGTTGFPKAIVGKNSSLWHFINWEIDFLGVKEDFRFSQFITPGFDAFLRDTLVPLCAGARICIPENKEVILESGSLTRWVDRNRLSVIHCVPSFFRLLNHANLSADHFRSLKYILMSGEKIVPGELENWYRIFESRVQLINLYGTTETTMVKTFYKIQKEDVMRERIPVGQPMKGARVIILDEKMRVCEQLEVGELFIRTPYRTYGYYGKPELTDAVFLPNPFSENPDDLIYKTGDLARVLADGNIELLGRIDRQVKIHGIRIELESVESTLLSHPDVKEAAVVKTELSADNEVLWAYVVSHNPEPETGYEVLDQYLKDKLPDYMVPAGISFLAEMPKKANGKLDYQSLPGPKFQSETGLIRPDNSDEEMLLEIWSDLLNTETIGVTDNFFHRGGNSLNTMALIARICSRTGIRFSLGEVFQNPTIRQQAVLLAELGNAAALEAALIPPAPQMDHYPVSAGQRQIFALQEFTPQSTVYNMPEVFIIKGCPDIKRMKEALRALVARHEALRSGFQLDRDIPRQYINKNIEFPFVYTEKPGADKNEIVRDFIRVFDFSRPPLLHVELVKTAENEYLWLIDMHHVISDGVSKAILVNDFMKLYQGLELAPLKIQYKDYVVWMAKEAGSAYYKKQETFWLEKYSTPPPVLELPTDYPRPLVQSFEGDVVEFQFDAGFKQQLKDFADKNDVTVFMLLFAAFSVLLGKYSRQEDLVIGTPVAGRRHSELENVMGMFVKTLAVRCAPERDKVFSAYLQEVKKLILAAVENQDYPFEELVEKVDTRRDISRSPLFDVYFVFQNMKIKDIEIRGLEISPFPFKESDVKNDLVLEAMETETALVMSLRYCTKLFHRETIRQMVDHFVFVVKFILTGSDSLLGEVPLMDIKQADDYYAFNNSTARYPGEVNVKTAFERIVEKYPGRPAVELDGTVLTYFELNRKANRIAHSLLSAGCREESPVCLLMDRSPYMIAAVLGIVKAGGTYIPVDPAYPAQRIHYILEDSKACFLITDRSSAVPAGYAGKILAIDDKFFSDTQAENPDVPVSPGQRIYVIYTSGSTGKPKGVEIEHRNVVQLLLNDSGMYDFNNTDVWTMFHSYCFDFSVWEIYGALLFGGKLLIVPGDVARDPAEFRDLLVRKKVTVLNQTPGAFYNLIREEEQHADHPLNLRYVIFGGEALNPGYLKNWYAIYPGTALINMYGITETTVHVTYKKLRAEDVQSEVSNIGKPYPLYQVYILDEALNLLPPGVIGEIFVGGPGVARGYFNRPQLTAERFIQNPFGSGRLYRSGDLGKINHKGELEYAGRKDLQVKIRGYRIESGEIEKVLLEQPGIKAAVVNAFSDGETDSLCAYLVASEKVETSRLTAALKNFLPDYMVPGYFHFLEEVPLTANGKIDRKKLPVPQTDLPPAVYKAPVTDYEKSIASIWKNVLNRETISVDANFFDLGGHSLKAIVIVNQIKKELQVEVSVIDLFTNPSIAELGACLEGRKSVLFQHLAPAEKRAYYPVSSQQKRLYALQQLEKESTAYNLPCAFWLEGAVDKDRVEKSIQKLIGLHESLRTSFEMIDGEPVQVPWMDAGFTLEYQETELAPEVLLDRFVRAFDLEKPPLVRAGLAKYPDNRYLLMFDLHHVIADGVSFGLLIKDFIGFYQGDGPEAARIQYKDYAVWQHGREAAGIREGQKKFWQEQMRGEIPVLDLPLDYPRPSVQSFRGAEIEFAIDEQTSRFIYAYCREKQLSLYMFLLSVYAVLLAKYSGQEDLVIGTPVVGRDHPDLKSIVGMFVNTLPLRVFPGGSKKFAAFTEEIKRLTLQAFDNQLFPFEELVEIVNVKRDAGRNPLFDTMFSLENFDTGELALGDLKVKPVETEKSTAKFDLSLNVIEENRRIKIQLEYCTDLFKTESVLRLKEHLLVLLGSIASDPDSSIKELNILSAEEKTFLIKELNQAESAFPGEKTIQDFIEATVADYADASAVVWQDTSLTYRQLNERANRLAHRLRKEGAGVDKIVALLLEPSLDMIIAILGVIKSGAAYLPIAPGTPASRLNYILESSQAVVLLTGSGLSGETSGSARVLFLDNEDFSGFSAENPENINTSENLLYVIYTSGSTGKPKGVMLEHRNLICQLFSLRSQLDIPEAMNYALLTSYTFDMSVQNIFLPLLTGGTLHVFPKVALTDPEKFLKEIVKGRIDVLDCVPSLLEIMLMANPESLRQHHFKYIQPGGEAFTLDLYNRLRKAVRTDRIINLYGPTEAAINAAWYECKGEEQHSVIPIGKSLYNYKLYILDMYLNPVPAGHTGEIYISGPGLARGYLRDPELTAKHFVSSPFDSGERMYGTGDLGRLTEEGTIEFLGRKDYQVKIRGFRIELEEIEAAMRKIDGIQEAVVVDKAAEKGGVLLCAYFSGAELSHKWIAGQLKTELADYMVPSFFIRLEEIPLTANGKLDRKALRQRDLEPSLQREILAPEGEKEKILAEVWERVLGINGISVDDNFFMIGGDSIKGIQIASALGNYGYNLEVINLFKYPTIREISDCLISNQKEIDQSPVEGPVPFTPIQKWFMEQKFAEPWHWNQGIMLFAANGFAKEVLEKVFRAIFKQHDALRMVVSENEQEMFIRRVDDCVAEVEEFVIDPGGEEKKICELAWRLQGSMDLKKGPLVKLGLFKTAAGDHLLLSFHHLVIDGVSWRILFEDFEKAYFAVLNHAQPDLGLKTHSYKTWAENLVEYSKGHDLKQELYYWKEICKAGEKSTASGTLADQEILTLELSREDTSRLLEKANKAYNTEINDLLLSALGATAAESLGVAKVLINLEGHGRENIIKGLNIQRTVGWFTSEFPVVLEKLTGDDLARYIIKTKEMLRRIPKKGIGYGLLRYLAPLTEEEKESLRVLPPLSFNYMGLFSETGTMQEIEPSTIPAISNHSMKSRNLYGIDINGMVSEGKLIFKIGYDSKKYHSDFMRKLAESFKSRLQEIIDFTVSREETRQTPSDFSHNDLEIDELDKIESQLELDLDI